MEDLCTDLAPLRNRLDQGWRRRTRLLPTRLVELRRLSTRLVPQLLKLRCLE